MPSEHMLFERINARWPIEPLEPSYHGEVARRHRFSDGAGELGFISSVSAPFCGSCTRAANRQVNSCPSDDRRAAPIIPACWRLPKWPKPLAPMPSRST